MFRKTTILFAILSSYATTVFAEDFMLDASTMAVGATAGENLVVKEGCLKPSETSCTDKIQWLTTISPTKVGNVQVIGQLSGDFEVIVTVDFAGDQKGIKILTADNKGFSFEFTSGGNFTTNGIGEGGHSHCCDVPGWTKGDAFNEIKIIAQNGVAKVYTNGQVFVGEPITFDANTIFERVAIEGIKSDDRLSDVKVRGIQGTTACSSTTTPSTSSPVTSSGDCTADYSADGNLHIPCVRVPGIFGGTQLYDVWMTQSFPSFSFNLDMNRVTLK